MVNIANIIRYMEQNLYSIQFVLEILELFWNIYLKISYFFENLINTFFRLILKIDDIFLDAFFPTLIIGNLVVATLVLAEIVFFSPQLTFSTTFQPGSLSQMLLAVAFVRPF